MKKQRQRKIQQNVTNNCNIQLIKDQNSFKQKLKSNRSFEVHSVTSQLKNSAPSTSQLNNQFHYKCQSELKQLVDNPDQYGQVIRLAYLTNNQQVHIDQEALYFLQKYSTFQIAFIAFIGEKQSGKSMIIDTILNLSCAKGNQFTTNGEPRQKGIYLWTIPFSYNFKRKLFIIQCSGISFQNSDLQRVDEILLDLINIMASSIVIVHGGQSKKKRKNPIFERQSLGVIIQKNIIEQLSKIRNRIINERQNNKKQDTFWPQVLYSIYSSKISSNIIQKYQQIYNYCSCYQISQPFILDQIRRQQYIQSLNNGLSGMNPLFINQLSQIFIELINKTSTKQYQNLRYTGNICCKLLINSIKYLNKKNKIKLNKIFTSILKQLYQSSYQYHTDLYDDYLKQYFNRQQPFSQDDLIQTFKISSTYTLDSFNQIIIDQKMHQQYQQQLQDYIQSKQQLLIQINCKKTKNSLKQKIKQVQHVKLNDIQSIKSFMINLNTIQSTLDHNRVFIISQKLLKYTKNIEKRFIQQRQRIQKQKIKILLQKIKNKQEIYQQLHKQNYEKRKKNNENEINFKKLLKQHTNYENNIKILKKQIDIQKKYQKQYIVSKQSKKQYAQNLLEILRQQQQKVRDNKKQLQEILKEYQYHPNILQLQKKIQQKQRQIKQLQKNQSKFDLVSRISAINSALHSKTSAVRSAIQKPKESKSPNNRPIKKLTKK